MNVFCLRLSFLLVLAWNGNTDQIGLPIDRCYAAQDSLQVAQQYLGCIRNHELSCAIALFHFSDHYSIHERERDQQAVRTALTLVSEEFGSIKAVKQVKEAPEVSYVSVGGGDLPYWAQHPHFQRLTFAVSFDREENGFIFIDMSMINGIEQIRQVHYGLPAARNGAKERITAIMKRMMNTGNSGDR